MKISIRLLLHIVLIAPITGYAIENIIITGTTVPSVNQAQQPTSIVNTPTETPVETECPSTMQQLTLKFKPVLTSLAGLASFSYLHDRSILLSHEAGHFVVSKLAGYQPTGFYVNPKFWGEGYVGYCGNLQRNPLSNILVSVAGPLGGIAAYMAWLKIWNILMHYWKTKNIKESFAQGIKGSIFNEDASLWAIGGTFWGASMHYLGNMIPSSINPINKIIPTYMIPGGKLLSDNDADHIQRALAKMVPLLGKSYPLLAYAGLAGLVGYGAYGVYVTYKAKKQAGKPLW